MNLNIISINRSIILIINYLINRFIDSSSAALDISYSVDMFTYDVNLTQLLSS